MEDLSNGDIGEMKSTAETTETTWDVPFNESRAVSVSNEEFLNILKPGAVIGRELNEPIKAECEECLITNCGCKESGTGTGLENSASKEGEDHANGGSQYKDSTFAPDVGNKKHGSEIMESGQEISTAPPYQEVDLKGEPLVKLNQILACGRGRAVRKSSAVDPSQLTNHEVTKEILSQGNAVDKLGDIFEDVTINEVKYTDLAEQMLTNEDSVGVKLGRFPAQKSFESLNNKHVRVTHVFSHNLIHVIDLEVMKNGYWDLLDDVNDVCKDEPFVVEEPEVGDMVCAPSDDGTMHRAVVESKVVGSIIVARLIDLGRDVTVSWKELKPFSDDLYRTPVLGYSVLVRNLEEELPLLSPQVLDNNLKPWILKQKLEVSEGKNIGGRLHEAIFSGPNFTLADKIRKFQVWEWEKLFETGLKTDVAIIEGKRWDIKDTQYLPATLFNQLPVMMEYSGALSDCCVSFKNIQLKAVEKEKRALQNQIDRFVEKVQAANHYPTIREIFLFRPDKSYWRRASRLDLDLIYCFDTHETFALKSKNSTRRMSPDFLKIPILAITCKFSGLENNSQLQGAIEKSFKEGQCYPIIVLNYDEKSAVYNISAEPYMHFLS